MIQAQLEALWQAALAQQAQRDWDGARHALLAILELAPAHPETLSALAIVTLEQGDLPAALALADEACRRDRRHPGLLVNLAMVLERTGDLERAEATCRKALRLEPRLAVAHHNLGNVLLRQRRPRPAVESLRRADALQPGDARVLTSLGNALTDAGDIGEAEAAFRAALRADPAAADAHVGLGALLADQTRLNEAQAQYDAALRAAGESTDISLALGGLAMLRGEMAPARAHFQRALELHPHNWRAISSLLTACNYAHDLTPRQIHRIACDATAAVARTGSADDAPAAAGPDARPRAATGSARTRLNIGWVSGDIGQHSVGFFLEPLLAALDRSRFELIAYPTAQRDDPTGRRLKALFGRWRPLTDLDTDAAARRVSEDRIDLLIDLSGHTRNNRLDVFARHPARVQASWCGYPATTGLAAIDWRITDSIADPPAGPRAGPGADAGPGPAIDASAATAPDRSAGPDPDSVHSERLYRLDPCFLCYRPPAQAPLPAAERVAGPLSFGSFNNDAKISPTTIALWARVLAACPGSRLLLKCEAVSAADERREALLRRLAGHGLDPERVDTLARTPGLPAHLACYDRVDVALDTWPYNGTTTTCEALWMGVPVVTLAGDRHSARVGASLLAAAGFGQWVAAHPDAFVERACTLAEAAGAPRSRRLQQREAMRGSVLLDETAFAARFAAALEAMAAGAAA